MSTRKSTAHEIVTMKTILAEVGQMTDGRWVFKPGWDDERVAKAVSTTLTANHSQHVRRALFGNMRRGRGLAPAPAPAPESAMTSESALAAAQPMMTPLHNPPLRRFVVTDILGTEAVIDAHFVFDNSKDGDGLIFRRKNSHDGKHDAVAFWPTGKWISVVRVDA